MPCGIRSEEQGQDCRQWRAPEKLCTTGAEWNWTRGTFLGNAEKVLRDWKTTKEKKWVTDEILILTDEKRQYKDAHPAKYKQLDRTIRKKIREAKKELLKRKKTYRKSMMTSTGISY